MVESIKFRPDPNLKIMDQVIQVLRYHHYSYNTEKTYRDWIIRFLKFFNFKIHPKNMDKKTNRRISFIFSSYPACVFSNTKTGY